MRKNLKLEENIKLMSACQEMPPCKHDDAIEDVVQKVHVKHMYRGRVYFKGLQLQREEIPK